jgi:hypothetical protein
MFGDYNEQRLVCLEVSNSLRRIKERRGDNFKISRCETIASKPALNSNSGKKLNTIKMNGISRVRDTLS